MRLVAGNMEFEVEPISVDKETDAASAALELIKHPIDSSMHPSKA